MSKAQSILDQLAQIASLVRPKPTVAMDRLMAMFLTVGTDELRVYETEIRQTIGTFFPKRRRILSDKFNQEIHLETALPPPPASPATEVHAEVGQLTRALRAGLADLSLYHIFLWSTFYRDFLSNFFADALQMGQRRPAAINQLAATVKAELSAHAEEIFTKGFKFVTETKTSPESVAVGKSLGGLQRFLEIPIEFYSAQVTTTTTLAGGRALRKLCSGMLSGILRGYANVIFGSHRGRQLIARNPRLWAHYTAFLTVTDLQEIILDSQDGPLQEFQPVVSVVDAVDQLLDSQTSLPVLPVLGQLLWDQRRLDVSLRVHVDADLAHLLEIQCFLDATYANAGAFKEAATRGTSLVLVPGRANLREQTTLEQPPGTHVIFTGPLEIAGEDARQVYHHLELEIFNRRRRKLTSDPLTFNFARDFPLYNPVLTKFFHVYRTSVRDLLRTIERRNGIRLWCSVRRSGKTVACFDLGDTAGPTTVVSQTSAAIHPLPNATLFKDLVDTALATGSDLPKDFFINAVKQCAPPSPPESERFVFVLDEYERLFGKLESVAVGRPELEHCVVLPLLDQMVSFSRDNLLIFMGQQPDAHHILMAQNQLSAYVQQDSFPLFTEPEISGEFSELLRKVFRQVADFDSSFANGVFAETAGHPFLTVKLLVAFVDSLIEENRTLGDLHFSGHDFAEYVAASLGPNRLGLNPEYDFFHGAIAEAISSLGKQKDPWLYAVYRSLQRLAQESPSTFRMSRSDFRLLCEELRTHELGFSADHIIRTATQANFLDYMQDEVLIKIRLLGRLAAISRERLRP